MENVCRFLRKLKIVAICANIPTPGHISVECKNPPANAGDVRDLGSIPGSESFPGVGNHNRLQYSCLGNSMDRGVWQAIVHGATNSRTQLSDCAHTYNSKSYRHP